MRRELVVLTRTIGVIGLVFIVLAAPTAPALAAPDQLDAHAFPIVPSIRGAVASRVRSLARVGRRLGNRSHVFSKIGDSITQWGFFMAPVGTGGLRTGDHPEVQPAV